MYFLIHSIINLYFKNNKYIHTCFTTMQLFIPQYFIFIKLSGESKHAVKLNKNNWRYINTVIILMFKFWIILYLHNYSFKNNKLTEMIEWSMISVFCYFFICFNAVFYLRLQCVHFYFYTFNFFIFRKGKISMRCF